MAYISIYQGVPDRDGVELLQLPQIQQHELQPNQRVQCGSRLSGKYFIHREIPLSKAYLACKVIST